MYTVYLTSIGLTIAEVGFLFMWTLLGDAAVSLTISAHADRFGRKRLLIASAVLALVTGLIFSTNSNWWILLPTAIVGIISPSGNEIGYI